MRTTRFALKNFIFVLLITALGCKRVALSRDDRPCDEGQCLEGYVCDLAINRCVSLSVQGDSNGAGTSCVAQNGGVEIACNGIDEDCSGADLNAGNSLDNCGGCGIACTLGSQVSAVSCDTSGGSPSCAVSGCAAGYFDADSSYANGCEYLCSPTNPSTEVCDNVDNNCSGQIDEGFSCRIGQSALCDAGSGPGSGQQSCTGACAWGTCVPRWQKRVKITFNNSAQNENLQNFPVLVILDSSRIAYADFAANGADVRFFDSDATTALSYEIERWDTSASSYIWVKVPQVNANSANDFIWLYYNQPLAADGQNPSAVWDGNYSGVWHLRENIAGTGTVGAYTDATSTNNDGTDNVASADKNGVIGLGQGFNAGDRISVPSSATLSPTNAITVEGWGSRATDSFGYRRAITLNNGTPSANYQVLVTLTTGTFNYSRADNNGDDLRFYAGSAPLNYWIERWNTGGTSLVWIKIPSAGTTSFSMYYGNPSAIAASDAPNVLDSGGLWLTTWNDGHTVHPADTGDMDALLAGLSYSTRTGWGPASDVDCHSTVTNCNPFGSAAQQDSYVALFEGWLQITEAGNHTFASDGDDAVDTIIQGTTWKNNINGGVTIASHYNGHSIAHQNSWDPGDYPNAGTGTRNLSVGYTRYQFRHEETTGADGHIAGWRTPTMSEFDYIPNAVMYHRKHSDNDPTSTLGSEVALGNGISKSGAYVLASVSGRSFFSIGSQTLSATTNSSWHYFAATYDRINLRLYVDGVAAGTLANTSAIPSNGNSVFFGDYNADPALFNGSLDELRISTVVRSGPWIAAQELSMTDAFNTYEAAQPIP